MNAFWRISWAIIIGTLGTGSASFGQLVINEVCTSNTSVLEDADGDSKDWIELLNQGTDTLNLLAYSLSDDIDSLAKWSFPDYNIAPGQYLTVFASGKNRNENPLWWQTLIYVGDNWRFLLPDQATPANWRELGFDDSAWENGSSGFGYGDDDDATVIPSTTSIFLRKSFFLESTSAIRGCVFHMDYDDGFIAFINGKEIARSGVNGDFPDFDVSANAGREALMYNDGEPERFDVQLNSDLLNTGENVIAIQVHNISPGSSDLSAIPFLSILSTQKSGELSPDILQLADIRFHTNFKLDAGGESLYLVGVDMMILDSIHIPAMEADHSYGRNYEDTDHLVVFTKPTPGAVNNTPSYEGYMEDLVLFSVPGGRFSTPFQLSLTTQNPGDTIFFTLDGTNPDYHSLIYNTSLEVSSDMIIRARIIKHGYVPGEVLTHTYYAGTDMHLPVVTISTDPDLLWDYHTGIYATGPNAEDDFPFFSANFWHDWEIPAHIGIFDEGGNLALDMDGGIKIYGGWTRGHPQKSMAIFARARYGTNKISYRLFEDKPIEEFEAFVIRNSGNDWFGEGSESGTMFRDVLMTRLSSGMDVDHQGSRQAIVYINGQYWGIHNIREKINEHFLASNNGVDPDELDLLESSGTPIQGDPVHFENMISFVQSNNLMLEENYEYLKTQMDIQNFINYQLVQIYYDNRDWPGNNIKYWRPRTPKGKWRWILYDTDFGFGLWDPDKVHNNTLLFATDPNGPDHPNPPWSTLLLRKLLANNEFKKLFINSFADRINTNFKSDTVSALVDILKGAIDQEMLNHTERWGGSYLHWVSQARELKNFGRLRTSIMHNHIKNTYGLTSLQNLTLDLTDPSQGSIRLNSIFVREFPWEGIYFQGNPIEITAIPRPGYRFTRWSGGISSDEPRIHINLSAATTLLAHFEPCPDGDENQVIINEICYKQDAEADSEDWIEIYNNSEQYIDISAWILKDSDDLHSYSIASGTLLDPGAYHVICRDKAAFESIYPSVVQVQGPMDFGLSSNGEAIRLYNQELVLLDSLSYESTAPWPLIPSGSGLTLSLIDPNLDNSLPGSWETSHSPLGTPGGNNDFILKNELTILPSPRDILFQNSPNPFSEYTRIVFYSGSLKPVRMTVHDLNGRLVKVLCKLNMETGYHEILWTPEQAGNGMYILRVETPESVYTQKMILNK